MLGNIKKAIILWLIGSLTIITAVQLYYKISYFLIGFLYLNLFFEIIVGYFYGLQELKVNSSDKDQRLKGMSNENFSHLIKVNGSNPLFLLFKLFVFFCLPTLLTEVSIFLILSIFLKLLELSKGFNLLWSVFLYLLLFHFFSWMHEFAHIIVGNFFQAIKYVVKIPIIKYKLFEICLGGGMVTKSEFRSDSFGKRLCCSGAGPLTDFILGLFFLIFYSYTNLPLFYIGFIINISLLYLNLLPLTIGGMPFDGKNITQELAFFTINRYGVKKDVYIKNRKINQGI